MQSLWNDAEAAGFEGDLAQRVYTSRLLGRDKVPAAEGASQPSGSRKSTRDAAGTPVEVSPGDVLTRERLERYLWSAADILRGSID